MNSDKWNEREFFERYNVYTDLAVESHEVISERGTTPEIPGVNISTEELDYAKISRVTVQNEIGAKMMGKAPGHYSTIEAPILRQHNREVQEDISKVLAKELEWFIEQAGLGQEDPVLVVGLGNWNATPDALGPRVMDSLMVTRHLLEMSPPELRKGLRPVAAIAPGVLGLTGIETGEIIFGVTQRIGAKAVICVDALASRSVERLCSTVQISDSGINPGAGVGNRRMAINQETLGVPVISIGIPTVVHAATIVSDALDMIQGRKIAEEVPQKTMINPDPSLITGQQVLNQKDANENLVNDQDKRQLISQVLQPYMGSMIVTPKEIDALIEDVTSVVAGGLNAAFHEGVDYSEVFQYLT